MDALGWAVVLLTIGLALAVLEVFIPSGGLIGFLSALSTIAGVCLAFSHGSWYGLSFLGFTLLAIPFLLSFAFRWWPHTPIGKRIMLDVPSADDVLPDNEFRRGLRDLVGQVGQAKATMLPSGAIEVAGRVYDAVSEGMAIDPGQFVRVIEVRGSRVVVRPLGPDELPQEPGAGDLKRPLTAEGPDTFEDPFA